MATAVLSAALRSESLFPANGWKRGHPPENPRPRPSGIKDMTSRKGIRGEKKFRSVARILMHIRTNRYVAALAQRLLFHRDFYRLLTFIVSSTTSAFNAHPCVTRYARYIFRLPAAISHLPLAAVLYRYTLESHARSRAISAVVTRQSNRRKNVSFKKIIFLWINYVFVEIVLFPFLRQRN